MAIPIIDFSSFLQEGDENAKKKVIDEFGKACLQYGFLQIVNHGLPQELIARTRQLTRDFFQYPVDEKLKSKPVSTVLPAGYGKMDSVFGCNEWLLISEPNLGFNVIPSNPPNMRETLEEMFRRIQKLGDIVQGIINEYLRLPHDFLKQFNDDRSKDAFMAWHYPPATTEDTNHIGREEHQDNNPYTLLLQDDVGGLEYKKDGSWLPITPIEGALVVNVGCTIQVLTNNKLMAVRHRVLKPQERGRQSFVFFYNIGAEKWLEPLPQFTSEIGEAPKYRGFLYKELLQARIKKEREPPSSGEKVIDINHFVIRN